MMAEAIREPWVWPLVLMLVGAAATYFWRGLGVYLAGKMSPDGPVFAWVSAVAYALLAGLIARMIVMPIGPLEATALSHRAGAAILALAVFFLTRRNMLLGVSAGCVTLILLTFVS